MASLRAAHPAAMARGRADKHCTPPPSTPRYLLLRSRSTVVVQPESIAAPPQSLGRRRGLR